MNLVIDIGNSRLKAAVFQDGRIIGHTTADEDFADALTSLTNEFADADSAIISSTRGNDCGLCELLRQKNINVLDFGPSAKIPITNRYATPQTLGRDRLAAAVGAAAKYPGRNIFIVDFGTAITQDIVSANGEFLGGSISPGLSARLRSLCESTGTLPIVDAASCRICNHAQIPNSTCDAIISGVTGGIEFEILGRIRAYAELFPHLITIFTGGDASLFEKRFKNTIFAEPDLVLAGLNTILDYNAH